MDPKLQRTDADQAILQECSLTPAGSPIIPSLPLIGLSAPFQLEATTKEITLFHSPNKAEGKPSQKH